MAAAGDLVRLSRDHVLESSRLVVELKERGFEEDPAAIFASLDGSWVRDIDDRLIKQELLASRVECAAQAGSGVIAESVETESEVDTLVRAGAGFAQGYGFAAPSPPSLGRPAGAAWRPTGNA